MLPTVLVFYLLLMTYKLHLCHEIQYTSLTAFFAVVNIVNSTKSEKESKIHNHSDHLNQLAFQSFRDD